LELTLGAAALFEILDSSWLEAKSKVKAFQIIFTIAIVLYEASIAE